MFRMVIATCGLALTACSPAGSVVQDAPPASTEAQAPSVSEAGMALIDVTIVSADKRHRFLTEVAATSAQQARGMMFRTEMGDDEGMLFPSGATPYARSFWMKNTPLALDIIFVGLDNRITNIEAGLPYSTDSVFSDGPATAVFEIRGGLSEELGIKPGDLLEYDLPADAAP